MEKILTIVIPTYNMEKYLDKCLTSLIIEDKELMKQLEVLVVVDGAKDHSSEIAHSYQNSFPDTFRVIDKENGNYGSCVNRGVKEAEGKYIKILDADDWFQTDVFAKYIRRLTLIDADMIITDYRLVNPDGKEITHRGRVGLSGNRFYTFNEIANNLIDFFFEMHAVTYRVSLLRELEYYQTEGISYTDSEWIFEPIRAVNTVYYLKETLYNYLIGREGQTMDLCVVQKSANQMEIMIKSLIQYYNKNYTSLDKFHQYYWNGRMHFHINYFYKLSLLLSPKLSSNVRSFDDYLRNINHDLYLYTDSIVLHRLMPLKYVKSWHQNRFVKIQFVASRMICKIFSWFN